MDKIFRYYIMESFHFAVLAIASVIFIIALTTIGVMMQKGSKSGTFPPMASNCPDGWTESSTPDADNIRYTCTAPAATAKPVDVTGVTDITIGAWTGDLGKTISYSDKTTSICDKQKWADKNSIVWDGVSNYTSC
jgi:hypothetical protein